MIKSMLRMMNGRKGVSETNTKLDFFSPSFFFAHTVIYIQDFAWQTTKNLIGSPSNTNVYPKYHLKTFVSPANTQSKTPYKTLQNVKPNLKKAAPLFIPFSFSLNNAQIHPHFHCVCLKNQKSLKKRFLKEQMYA